MKILVLQLKRIGDLVLTTPALAALRTQFPDAKITLVVSEAARDLLPALDYVDEHLVVRRKESNFGLWWKLICSHFDVCLDFTGNDRSAFFTFLSKAEKRIAFQRIQKSRARSLFYNRFVNSPVRTSHTVDHYLDLLKPLRESSGAAEPDLAVSEVTLHLPEWADKKAGQILERANVRGEFVVIHPGTARPEKFWEPERWAEVIDFCRDELKLQCVLTGANGDLELPHIRKIQEALKEPCVDLSGQLDLLSLAALFEKARLFLSVDTGPMHLASAFGTPQIALFGKTNPFHWRPRHEDAMVLLAGSPLANPPLEPRLAGRPMDELSTRQVIDAIKLLIEKTAKNAKDF